MSDDKKEEKTEDKDLPEIESLDELGKLFKTKASRTAAIADTVNKLSGLEVTLVKLKEDERLDDLRISQLINDLHSKFAKAVPADAGIEVSRLLKEPEAKIVFSGAQPPDPIMVQPAGPWTSLLASQKITKT